MRAQCRRAPAAWPLKSSLCSDMGPFSTIHRFSTQHDMGYTNSRPDWSQEILFDEHFTLSSPNCRRYGRRACRGTSLELLPVLCLPVLCLSCPVCGQPRSSSAMTWSQSSTAARAAGWECRAGEPARSARPAVASSAMTTNSSTATTPRCSSTCGRTLMHCSGVHVDAHVQAHACRTHAACDRIVHAHAQVIHVCTSWL